MTGGSLIEQRVLGKNEAGLSLDLYWVSIVSLLNVYHVYIGISVCILLPLTTHWCIPGIPIYSLVCFSPLSLPLSSICSSLPPPSFSPLLPFFLRQGLIQLRLALNLLTLLTPVCHQPVQFYVVLGIWT